jgi:GTP-binding protein
VILPADSKAQWYLWSKDKHFLSPLTDLQDRGKFFIDPGEQIYVGQVLGEHSRDNDLEINVIKGKKLTNMRASGSDENMKIAPKIQFSLEEAMEYIRDDEYLEVTPLNLRMRKIKF